MHSSDPSGDVQRRRVHIQLLGASLAAPRKAGTGPRMAVLVVADVFADGVTTAAADAGVSDADDATAVTATGAEALTAKRGESFEV